MSDEPRGANVEQNTPTTRTWEDGFRGEYPNLRDDQWVIDLYRKNGMEPPWLQTWKDGEVVEGN